MALVEYALDENVAIVTLITAKTVLTLILSGLILMLWTKLKMKLRL